MPLYQYQALDVQGLKHSGVIDAHNDKEAKDKLRDLGLMVSKLSASQKGSGKGRMNKEALMTFTMQLSQLVNAGVPLYESLMAIEELYRKEAYHRVIVSVGEQIKSGKSFSEALSTYPDSFDKLYCAMISAGEAVGSLPKVLEKLSFLLSKQIKLRKEIVTALIYPSILACFAMVVIMVLLGFVIPSIEGIFADRELNGFTSLVLSLSKFFRGYWWVYLPLIAAIVTYSFIKLRSPAGKIWLQRFLLKVPFIRNVVLQAAVARFCRTMGTLQEGGLTMLDSLRISRSVMQNVVLEEEMKVAETKIIEGSSLSAQLGKSAYIPQMVTRMLAIGEDSGSTTVMLNKVADMYEDDLEKTLNRMVALIQPIILVIMGGVIGLVMIAILLPLTDIASFSVE